MSNDTIFFSYSRDDSEFVLSLAKELRQAGADIWLDQLDIKPGSRWDSSIEQALASSKTLLVILSKSSVESNNVMDEVSYALEEKKMVVPVLLEPCDIPFRLKRLQYANFTQDHKVGIINLIETLNLEAQVASKLSGSAKVEDKKPEAKKESVVQPVVEKKVEPAPNADQKETAPQLGSNIVTNTKKTRKTIFMITGAGVVVLLLLFVVIPALTDTVDDSGEPEYAVESIDSSENEDGISDSKGQANGSASYEEIWERIKNSKSIEDFIFFGMIYSDEPGFDYMKHVYNPIDDRQPHEALVIWSYPDGARPFNNAYSMENGNLNWLDDGMDAGVGNLLKAKGNVELFDANGNYLDGEFIREGQIVQVLEAKAKSEDGYVFILIAYGDK